MSFIASPEIVMALGIAGRLSFNPMTDSLKGSDGVEFKLTPPAVAPEVPADGYAGRGFGYEPPVEDGANINVSVDPQSSRLQVLQPFTPWDGEDFDELRVLVKAQGKCTTDHISPAGPWLRFRGHLDKLSDNAFLGAVNAFTDEAGIGLNQLTGERAPFPSNARAYKQAGHSWVAIGDFNYGEGSSREHAAMSPRLLGCKAVIVRSFARIHETNLKKQGILPFTFADSDDYERILEADTISITGLNELAPGKSVKASINHFEGGSEEIELTHTLSEEQIQWFKAGAALNILGQ